jgi:hypothetical protein
MRNNLLFFPIVPLILAGIYRRYRAPNCCKRLQKNNQIIRKFEMSIVIEERTIPTLLEDSPSRAVAERPFSGQVTPTVAWELGQSGATAIVDVRGAEKQNRGILVPHSSASKKMAAADGEAKILDRASVVAAITDYVLQVNFRGYQPDYRKVLAVRESDRTASLRNAVEPVRWEVYYFIEGELFPEEGVTCLRIDDTPQGLAKKLVDEIWAQLWAWNAYDFTPTSSGLNQGYSNSAGTATATARFAAGTAP